MSDRRNSVGLAAHQHQHWNTGTMDFEIDGNDNAVAESDLVVDSIHRKLVSLRIQDETEDVGGDGATDAYIYKPVCRSASLGSLNQSKLRSALITQLPTVFALSPFFTVQCSRSNASCPARHRPHKPASIRASSNTNWR